VQAQASAELGACSSMMSKDLLVAYRKELARAFAAQGNHAGAEAEYNTILGIDPTNHIVQELLVEELIVSAKYDAASDVLHQLMLGKEENPTYTMMLGRIALLKNNTAEATFQLEKALAKDPSMRQLYTYLADAYALSGNNAQAIKYYNLAIQYADELIAKTGQGNRFKEQNQDLPEERLRYLNATVRINLELQDYTNALVAAQRLVKLDE
jgi:predicted Zn-dependent protease